LLIIIKELLIFILPHSCRTKRHKLKTAKSVIISVEYALPFEAFYINNLDNFFIDDTRSFGLLE